MTRVRRVLRVAFERLESLLDLDRGILDQRLDFHAFTLARLHSEQ